MCGVPDHQHKIGIGNHRMVKGGVWGVPWEEGIVQAQAVREAE
jgi:hypothetical protein